MGEERKGGKADKKTGGKEKYPHKTYHQTAASKPNWEIPRDWDETTRAGKSATKETNK